MSFNTDLAGRTAETLTAGFTGSIGTTVTLAGTATLSYADNTLIAAYGLSAGESEGGVHVVFTEGGAGTNLWQSAVVTLDYDANSLTIDSIKGSSNGGLPVTFTAAAANVPLYHPPITVTAAEAEPVVFPNTNPQKFTSVQENMANRSTVGITTDIAPNPTKIVIMFRTIRCLTPGVPYFHVVRAGSSEVTGGHFGTETAINNGNTAAVYSSPADRGGIAIMSADAYSPGDYIWGEVVLTRINDTDGYWRFTVTSNNSEYRQSFIQGSVYVSGSAGIGGVYLYPPSGATFTHGYFLVKSE